MTRNHFWQKVIFFTFWPFSDFYKIGDYLYAFWDDKFELGSIKIHLNHQKLFLGHILAKNYNVYGQVRLCLYAFEHFLFLFLDQVHKNMYYKVDILYLVSKICQMIDKYLLDGIIPVKICNSTQVVNGSRYN